MKRHSTVKEPDNMAISFIRGSARGLRATLLALMLMCVAGAIATTGLPATTLCHVSIGSVRQAATLPDAPPCRHRSACLPCHTRVRFDIVPLFCQESIALSRVGNCIADAVSRVGGGA